MLLRRGADRPAVLVTAASSESVPNVGTLAYRHRGQQHELDTQLNNRGNTSMRTTRTTLPTAVTVAALTVVLTGCGDSGTSDAAGEPAATVTVTETADASEAPSSTPSETETPTADASPTSVEPNVGDRALKVGQWREGTGLRTRVVEFYQPSDGPMPSYLNGSSDAYGAVARVEMCVPKGAEPAKGDIWDLWFGYDTNGGQYTRSSSSWEVWPPLPQLPAETSISPGKCLSGWVLLSAPRDTKLVTVDLNDGEGGSVAEWKVG